MIKNIIFDLGGVLLGLRPEAMQEAFSSIGIPDITHYFNLVEQSSLFLDFEVGKVTEKEFYQTLRQMTGSQATDEEIAYAWNQLLGDFDPKIMTFVESLRKTNKVFLFSNTNAIHQKAFEYTFEEEFGFPLSRYFDTVFYSHILHLRKPEAVSFQKVLDIARIQPEETIFVDDSQANLLGANEVGLRTWHIQSPQEIVELKDHLS